MLQTDDTLDDLIVLARRGDLPESDERRLRERLASAALDRELYEAGRAFDAEAPVQDDDADRIDRLVRDVDRRIHASRRSPVRTWAPRVLLAAIVLTGATVGAVKLATLPDAPVQTLRADDVAAPVAAPAAATRTSVRTAAVPSEPAAEIVPEPALAPETAPVAPAPDRRHTHKAQRSASHATQPEPPVSAIATPTPTPPLPDVAPEPTASELFAAANAARVRQDLTEAIRVSRQLLSRYPESAQATTARLSLGLIYLQLRQPALALDELQAAPVSPEALWSKSLALRDLGRHTDERTALEDLLRRYPRSAYSSAVTKRLESLR